MSTTPTTDQPPGFDKDKFNALANDDNFRDNYAFHTAWADILQPHGWVYLGSDSRGEHWDRPGRTGGRTPRRAALTREYGPLTVFTTSTKFEARTPYSKFDAYAVLNYDGDRRAAAQALHNQGFDVFREQDINGNQIVRCGKYSYTWPWRTERRSLSATLLSCLHQCPQTDAKSTVTSQDKPRSLV